MKSKRDGTYGLDPEDRLRALQENLSYAKWLFDTDLRLSEHLNSVATSLLAAAGVELTVIAGFAATGKVATRKTAASQFESVWTIFEKHGWLIGIVGYGVLAFPILTSLFCIRALWPRSSDMPIPQYLLIEEPLGMPERSYFDVLKALELEVISCIRPPVDRVKGFSRIKHVWGKRLFTEDSNERARSLWQQNSIRKQLIQKAMLTFVGAQILLVVAVVLLLSKL